MLKLKQIKILAEAGCFLINFIKGELVMYLVPINMKLLPKKSTHICFFVVKGGTEISLWEMRNNEYIREDVKECKVLHPIIEKVFVKKFLLTDREAAPLMLMLYAQDNIEAFFASIGISFS